MDDIQSKGREEHPIYSFSLTVSTTVGTAFVLLWGIGSAYNFLTSGGLTFGIFSTLTLVALDAYYINIQRKMPLRKAKFYENHFEVSGWKLNRNLANYDEIEGLSRVKKFVGDIRSGGNSINFSNRGESSDLTVPNRRVGKEKKELYSWLLERNSKASTIPDEFQDNQSPSNGT